LKKKVRRAERHIDELGTTCLFYSRKNIPQKYLTQLNNILNEWHCQKGGKEKGFSMTLGRIPQKGGENCHIVLAIQNDTVIGYLSLVPVYGSRSFSLDSARKRKHLRTDSLSIYFFRRSNTIKSKNC